MGYKHKLRILFLIVAALLLNAESFAQPSNGLNRKTPLYQNPIFDFDFPDPTVIRAADGYFYAYATQTFINGSWVNIQAARSVDLETWERFPDALPI